ncbi:uncharacterized protein LOC128728242 [Anopheles nili]|uniref:uncharacterized protein LOC128728242 n=1 Tax=Anopheles nili TaxID=185578 RepID=UPI00237AE75A|nr:uncharacterized protein LOC128728242 [Anopheles nili]XP_053677837.1 uncharacterized protein LOC128728242 [Anopheles nili]XP_053677838.1 uncharacterized protein LOC128728242 [Anopheles nili]
MHVAAVCILLGATLALSTGTPSVTDGKEHPQSVTAKLPVPSVNTTVSKVIEAMLTEGDSKNGSTIPIPEHHHDRAQRIVARKGVSNEAAPVTKGSTLADQPPVDSKPPLAFTERTQNGSTSTVLVARSNVTLTATTASVATSTTVTNASSTSTTTSTSKPSPPQSKSPATNSSAVTMRPSTVVSNTSTTSTTVTATSTNTTIATTTKPPRKPKITFSIVDEPRLLQAAKPGYVMPNDPVDGSGRLRVDEPLAQFSKELLPPGLGAGEPPNSRREYVAPIVTLIFAIPLLLGLFLLSYRRAKEFWLTRHYRRMDFLIDGMYNY